MSPELILPPLAFSIEIDCQVPCDCQRAWTLLPSTSMWLPLPERVFKKTVSPERIPEPGGVVVSAVVVSTMVVDTLAVVDARSNVEVVTAVGPGFSVGNEVVEGVEAVVEVQSGHNPQLL